MRDLGDFQTPPALVAAVLDQLGLIGTRWTRVLEPTCGRGHFLSGVLAGPSPPRQVLGIEIQEGHADVARVAARGHGDVLCASLFDLDLTRDLPWDTEGPLLVLGNPPWITSAELGLLESGNVPHKRNVKGMKGLEARTGASNFDIAEAVWLKLIAELADQRPTIALLCKTTVARAVLAHAREQQWPIAEASIHRIDATKWFRAAVDGCLLRVRLGPGTPDPAIPIFSTLGATAPECSLGFTDRGPVADSERYGTCAFADGLSPVTWRQGVKHDAADVMELTRERDSDAWRNRLGEAIDVEPEYVYPLLKGGDLARIDGSALQRAVIVTQRSLGENTRLLAIEAPRLWAYLTSHAARFDRRKSSIYRDRPPFSLFGIGPYSFAPYKVTVSGLHKSPRFRAYGPERERPRLCDDTCYFLPFASAQRAALAAALLDEPSARDLVHALLFRDAKRPVTKKLLQRIDLLAVLDRAERHTLLGRADEELSRLGGRPGEWPDPLEPLLAEPEDRHSPEFPR
ncbi:MAG: class I SAM-dependent methyltransferase [Isosphaeraceae bacterium]|nr:class I SAM-dependent methyltransferase [Isosphaeraceae bacterium]